MLSNTPKLFIYYSSVMRGGTGIHLQASPEEAAVLRLPLHPEAEAPHLHLETSCPHTVALEQRLGQTRSGEISFLTSTAQMRVYVLFCQHLIAEHFPDADYGRAELDSPTGDKFHGR